MCLSTWCGTRRVIEGVDHVSDRRVPDGSAPHRSAVASRGARENRNRKIDGDVGKSRNVLGRKGDNGFCYPSGRYESQHTTCDERINVSEIQRPARARPVAPSAIRTACSRLRDETRVSMRPDTLAQPIGEERSDSREQRPKDAPYRPEDVVEQWGHRHRGPQSGDLRHFVFVQVTGETMELVAGHPRSVAPGRSLPITNRTPTLLSASGRHSAPEFARMGTTGVQKSVPRGKSNPSGITPTIV